MPRAMTFWILVGLIGVVALPWYALDLGLFSSAWLRVYPNADTGAALYQIAAAGRAWLLLPVLPLLAVLVVRIMQLPVATTARLMQGLALAGLAMMLLQGFAIIHNGPSAGVIGKLAPLTAKQPGMGYGALALGTAYLMLLACALAAQGYCRGDLFVVGSITLVVALISLFVFFPVLTILASAFQDDRGQWAPLVFFAKFTDKSIWGLGCITGGVSCGVAWNTAMLALAVATGSTVLGMAFALVAVRTDFRAKGVLRLLTVLPIITPPFVIGLALILLFGRSFCCSGAQAW